MPKRTLVALVAAAGMGAFLSPAASYAASYLSTTKTVVATGTVSCGTGWRVTGGGTDMLARDTIGSSTSTTYKLIASRPTATGWTASAVRVGGRYSSSYGWQYTTYIYNPRVYALCIR